MTHHDRCRPRKSHVRTSDDWFAALDGRRIGAGKASRRVLVTGIHRAGGDYWIQAAVDGADDSVVIRVSADTTSAAALQMLAAAPAAGHVVLRMSRAA